VTGIRGDRGSDPTRASLEGQWLPPLDADDDRALGTDPFARTPAPHPFDAGLTALGFARLPTRHAPVPDPPPLSRSNFPSDEVVARQRPRNRRVDPGARPQALHRNRGHTPLLADVDPGSPTDWLDRVLDDDERKRLFALMQWRDADSGYDRFGLSPTVLRRTFPLFLLLYRAWFRVRSSGHQHLPTRGPAILASNHGGLLPFDGAMLVMDVALSTDPPRLLRAIVDHWAGSLSYVNVFFARVGQVIGTRENFADLLADDQLVLVFPEGMNGIRKLITQRHRVQSFHVGFVEQALRAGAPIIPTAVIGSDDQAPILFDIKPLARLLGLPVAPVTPTFPWLGPLGLIPYPVPYRIVYGEPLRFNERFGPEDADDPRLVRYLARLVRKEVQALIDRSS
jgi:1-acyl-sn-glycerol-3-phosphate acyltransferase